MKKISKKLYLNFFYYIDFFFHMFDIQLGQLPQLCPSHQFKESLLVIIEYMNGISQNREAWGGQNDPQPCPQGDLNPGQYILTKKVMEKVKFRLMLYQLSYAAKLQKYATFHNTY